MHVDMLVSSCSRYMLIAGMLVTKDVYMSEENAVKKRKIDGAIEEKHKWGRSLISRNNPSGTNCNVCRIILVWNVILLVKTYDYQCIWIYPN